MGASHLVRGRSRRRQPRESVSPHGPRRCRRRFRDGRYRAADGPLRVSPADGRNKTAVPGATSPDGGVCSPASRSTLEEGSADDQATLRPDRIPPARRQPHDHRTTGAGVDPNVGESGTLGVGVGCRINPFEPIECGYGAPEGATLQLQCFYWHGDPLRPNGNTVWWRVTFGSKDVFIADHSGTTHAERRPGWPPMCATRAATRPLPACESDAHSWYNGTGRL
jgi:hypothetical protein